MAKIQYIIKGFIVALVACVSLCCCEKPVPVKDCTQWNEQQRKVLLLYSAGFNSLRDYLLQDIADLKSGWLPKDECENNILLVYTHTPKRSSAYSSPTTPYLIRLYGDESGKVVADTLVTYPEATISASAAQMNKVLTYVKDNFVAKSYGMIFSSHATGYLPAGYYSYPDDYVFNNKGLQSIRGRDLPAPVAVPYAEPEWDPSLPMVKSVGQDRTADANTSYEMDIRDFAEAIPMKLDYLLFDACLMGGVEVAYELRGKVDKVGFSQAEVLAEGLDYETLTQHLLREGPANPQAVCADFFKQYDEDTGVFRSATISCVDCNKLETLAQVCKDIFAAHREELSGINPDKVQQFYRGSKHWFYDLESVVTEAGATETELASLAAALNECVLYKAHTPEFMGQFDIKVFSGFSMYLPCDGGEELDKYYKTLSWNKATGLVE